jgi:excisionase family DNA binding protein
LMKRTKPKEKPILTAEEVADFLDIHRETVYLYAKTGRLPAFKVGYSWRFKYKSIEKWIEEQEDKEIKT